MSRFGAQLWASLMLVLQPVSHADDACLPPTSSNDAVMLRH
jgi:hypothetical protein